jgi:dCTP diphosphatase
MREPEMSTGGGNSQTSLAWSNSPNPVECGKIATMNSDSTTTIQTLKHLLREFRDERDWEQFHDPKNLAEAISIEAGELLELFLWQTPANIKRSMKDPKFKKTVEEELADVLCFSLNLANVAGIDIASAVKGKVEANRRKYPVSKARGKSTKYNRL